MDALRVPQEMIDEANRLNKPWLATILNAQVNFINWQIKRHANQTKKHTRAMMRWVGASLKARASLAKAVDRIKAKQEAEKQALFHPITEAEAAVKENTP